MKDWALYACAKPLFRSIITFYTTSWRVQWDYFVKSFAMKELNPISCFKMRNIASWNEMKWLRPIPWFSWTIKAFFLHSGGLFWFHNWALPESKRQNQSHDIRLCSNCQHTVSVTDAGEDDGLSWHIRLEDKSMQSPLFAYQKRLDNVRHLSHANRCLKHVAHRNIFMFNVLHSQRGLIRTQSLTRHIWLLSVCCHWSYGSKITNTAFHLKDNSDLLQLGSYLSSLGRHCYQLW